MDPNEEYFNHLFKIGKTFQRSEVSVKELQQYEFFSPHLNNSERPIRKDKIRRIYEQLEDLNKGIDNNDDTIMESYEQLLSGRICQIEDLVQLEIDSKKYVKNIHHNPKSSEITKDFIRVSIIGGDFEPFYECYNNYRNKADSPRNPLDWQNDLSMFEFDSQESFYRALICRNNLKLSGFINEIRPGSSFLVHAPNEPY